MNRYLRHALVLAMTTMAAAPVVRAAQATQEDELASPKLRIAWAEFKKAYDDGTVVVVDVRGDDAYSAGHIPGARSISYDAIDKHASELKKLKKPIVLYCS